MMGRRKSEQGQLFYAFDLEAVVPGDHQVRRIAAVLDLSWVRAELAPHYSHTGRPSIDPELMIRMLILGYVSAIRSERALCLEVQLNLAYRWFCGLGIETRSPIIQLSRALVTSASANTMYFASCSSVWLRPAFKPISLVAAVSQSMQA
jgi:hypothetical protein